ncbi:lipase family protein [Moritella sp. 5]|uniref:lipase family protein n=1 Tax=Moritella sp. 5 TaxID=2746231 RepID=UPI001BAE101F|nr:lipase family protein [Moritella sp. 5]QUM81994.1 lipase family protein [Moritella sp. 5]
MDLPKGFDLDLALELACLSNDAYSQYDAYKEKKVWAGPEGYKLEITFQAMYESQHVPLGFVVSKGDNIYVSWRGTSSVEEWVEDVKFEQIRCSYLPGHIDVELGFYQLYATGQSGSSPQNIVLNFLKEKQIKGTLYITGHSLGSALSVLNTLDIAKNTNLSNLALYTFAGPRVGSPEFTSIYNSAISDSWRVVNLNDEVPNLPLKDSLGNDYRHVNKEFDITFGGECPWEWGDNHSLTNYINQLHKLKKHIMIKSAILT